MAAIRVDQRAVSRSVEQRALVMLAVYLHQIGGDGAQRLRAHALIVDEGAGAPVRHLDAAEDELAVGVDVLRREGLKGAVRQGQIERRRDLSLRLALSHETAVAARTERQGERIEENGFAGARLAGEDRQAVRKLEVQLIDQHDVADRKPGEHGRGPGPSGGNDGMIELGNPGLLVFPRL